MFRRIFINSGIPVQYRSNFLHFYFDIGWFGLLSGSAASFLSVYLTHLGASSLHIGLLGATGAAVSLLLAIPAGRWLERRPVSKASFGLPLLSVFSTCFGSPYRGCSMLRARSGQ